MTKTVRGRTVKRKNYKSAIIGISFIIPALFFNLLFDWYPMLQGVIMSFYRWDGFRTPRFIGVDNFIKLIGDQYFWVSMENMLFFFTFNVILMLPAIITSVVLFRIRSKKTQYLYRVLFCIPMVVQFIVVLLIWQFMYNPQYGFFNQLLEILGLGDFKQTWLGDENLARWCILFINFPWVQSNALLIYLGGLQSVDGSIWEAADLDGVNPLQKFLYLEFPLIRGQFKLNLIGAFTGGITGYTLQLILTGGGPGFETLVPGLHMYKQAFEGKYYGYAAAIALALFALSAVVTFLSMRFLKSEED